MTGDAFLIRVDAGHGIGLGHLQRCLGLAEALHYRGARVAFLLSSHRKDVFRVERARFPAEAMPGVEPGGEEDYEYSAAAARRHACHTIVIDSYAVRDAFLKKLRHAGFGVVAINDEAREASSAHVVINGGAHAKQLSYGSAEGDTEFLLGPRYALLRQSFWNVSARDVGVRLQRLLLCVGGDDTLDVMPHLVETVDGVVDQKCALDIVVGPYFKKSVALDRALPKGQRAVRLFADPEHLHDLIKVSDAAVTAGGQITYELAASGTPAVALALFDNQEASVRALANFGTLLFAGRPANGRLPVALVGMLRRLASDATLRQSLSRTAQACVDGGGALRAAEVLHPR